jgi:hypothetical protein
MSMPEPGKKKRRKAKSPKQNKGRPQRDEKGMFLPGNSAAAKWSEEKAVKIGKELIEWMEEQQQNFWIRDFLLEHELYGDVVSYLSEKYPPFSEYIARAKEIEASRIQKFAMMNQLNSGMAQWVLSVHHKLQNVQKTETEVKSSQPIVVHVDADDARG